MQTINLLGLLLVMILGWCDWQPEHLPKLIDVFESDTVKLTCKGNHQLHKQRDSFGRSLEHDQVSSALGPLEISVWTYLKMETSGSRQIVFAYNKNKVRKASLAILQNCKTRRINPDPDFFKLSSQETDNLKEGVMTTSGNSNESNCVFPFHYKDKKKRETVTSYMCLNSGRQDATCWCSTTADFTEDMRWGFCPCAIPRHGVRLMAEYGTDPGSYCTFPFKYNGELTCFSHPPSISVEYDQCTYEGRGRCWCGTVYDVSKYDKWGYCPCAGTAFKGHWSEWGKWSECDCGEMTYRSRTCHNPYVNIPTGRSVLCGGGHATEAALCSCLRERYEGSKQHLVSLQDRVSVEGQDENSNFSSLTLRNLTSKDSGLYFCNGGKINGNPKYQNLRQSRLAVFQLNVVDQNKAQRVLEDNGQNPGFNMGKHGGDWVTWIWTDWQSCDRCGIIAGEKKRIGFCYTKQTARHGLQEHLISCRSQLNSPAKLARLEKFRDYILVKTCKTRCHINRHGFIVVKAKPGEFPDLPEAAKRVVMHAAVGGTVHLACPKAHSLLPVAWQYEGKGVHSPLRPILRNKLQELPPIHGAEISNKDSLMVHDIAVSNAGYFSCFVNRTLSVSYSLVVDEKTIEILEEAIDYTVYVILFAVLFIFGGAGFAVMKSSLTSKLRY